MTCPSCHKEVAVDSFFCAWCDRFIPVPEKGTKANLFARWVALMIDPLIAVVLWFVAVVSSEPSPQALASRRPCCSP
jgi:hypothetical protein